MRRSGRLLRALARTALVLAVLLEVLYLARRPLFERLVLQQAGRLLAGVLDAEVTIAALGGNWITSFRIEGIEVRGRGVLQRIERGTIDAAIDPFRLARGDLAGLRWAEARVAVLELDLRAGSDEPPAAGPGAGFPDEIAQLFPEGARVVAERIVLRSLDAALDGPATLEVAARPHGEPLPFALEAAVLSVGGVPVGSRKVDRVEATGSLHGDLLRVDQLRLGAPGLDLSARGVSMLLEGDDFLARLSGSADVAVTDLLPYADLLPEAARRHLPATGRVSASADRGVLVLDRSEVRAGGLEVDVGGSIPLEEGSSRRGWLAFRATIVDPSRLALPEGFPFLPHAGQVSGRIEGSGLERFGGSVEIELRATERRQARPGPEEPPARQGHVAGRIAVARDPDLRVQPDLRLSGGILRGTETAEVRGDLRLSGSRLHVAALHLAASAGGRASVRGDIDLAAEWPRMVLEGASAEVALDDLVVAPWLELAGVSDVTGRVGGTLHLEARDEPVLVADLSARVGGLLCRIAEGDTVLQLRIAMDEEGTVLEPLHAEVAGNELRVEGSLPGLTLAKLLADPAGIVSERVAMRGFLAAPDLGALDLRRFGVESVVGELHARLEVAGTVAAPSPLLTVELRQVGLAIPGAPAIAGLTGAVVMDPSAVHLQRLTARVHGHDLELHGSVRTAGESLELPSFEIRVGHAGRVTVQGRLGILPRALSDLPSLARALRTDADLTIRAEALELAPLFALLEGFAGARGRLDATVRWRAIGTPIADVDVGAQVEGLSASVAGPVSVRLAARSDGSGTAISRIAVAGAGVAASGTADLLGFTATDFLVDPASVLASPVRARIAIADFDLGSLDAARLGFFDLRGTVKGSVALAGTISAPQPTAEIELADVVFRTADLPRVSEATGRISLARNAVRVPGLKALLGEGPVAISGSFVTGGVLWEGWREGRLDLAVEGKDALLYRARGLRLRADLALTLTGVPGNLTLGGRVDVHSSKLVTRIPLLDIHAVGGERAVEGLALLGPALPEWLVVSLNVQAVLKEPFEIDSNLLVAKVSGALAIRGTLAMPAPEGTLSAADARLIMPGMSFRGSTMLVRFDRADPRFPTLNIRAEGKRRGYTVILGVTGAYHEPEILLSSIPPLPPEDLAVLVTTGTLPATFESQGVVAAGQVIGTYLAEELADYFFGSESTEAKESFVERFTVDTATDVSRRGNENIVVEYRLLENVYLQGERDVYEDVNLGLVYRIRFR